MSFRLGLVGLCTSHPESWVPVIRKMTEEKIVDVEVVAAWDSGETRPENFAQDFCKEFSIPNAVKNHIDMMDMVDGVIVHTSNWDKHIEQARPFVEEGKAVLVDKPLAGNMRDLNQLLDWAKQGKRITGGSSLLYTKEVKEFLAKPVAERGEVHAAYSCIGVDDFNYGIHAYAMVSCLMGPGVLSVKYITSSRQKHITIKWADGNTALLTVGKAAWLPFNLTVVTDKNIEFIKADTSLIYRSLLEAELPYLTGKTDIPPMSFDALVEPEKTAIAARMSWMNKWQEIFLTDLRNDDEGYDGKQFAIEYRHSRMVEESKKLIQKILPMA